MSLAYVSHIKNGATLYAEFDYYFVQAGFFVPDKFPGNSERVDRSKPWTVEECSGSDEFDGEPEISGYDEALAYAKRFVRSGYFGQVEIYGCADCIHDVLLHRWRNCSDSSRAGQYKAARLDYAI